MEPRQDLQELLNSNEKPAEQAISKIQLWQTEMSAFFNEYEENASAYRLMELEDGKRTNTFTKTRVGETLRATEAITTSMFRMLTVADPNFDVLNMNGSQTQDQVFGTGLMLRYQDRMLKYKRNLLRGIRGLSLFGTTIMETPWVTKYRFGRLIYEGLALRPRSLLQCPFDPFCLMIEDSGWQGYLDYVSEDFLLDMAENDPDHWDPAQIQLAIDGQKTGAMSSYLESRRRRAGYREGPKFEIATYYGRLKGHKREDGRLWCIRVINEEHIVSAFPNPSPIGEIPRCVARYTDFELEPYGYGVGKLGKTPQRHMDENRRRYMDLARMSLMNMWLKDRMSGIKTTDLKIKPLAVIEGDDISENAIRRILPDLEAISVGFKIEEMARAEHQGNTGASQGLQAQVTEASATEASIAQNEAIRRLSVIAEDVGESLVRDFHMTGHEYNMQWLESDLWLAVSGQEKPIRVNRRTMAPFVDIEARITTDKNFRPQRIRNIIEAIKGLSSIRQRQNILVDDTDLWKELMVCLDISPSRVIRSEDNLSQQSVLSFLAANANAAKAAQSELGPEVEAVEGQLEPTTTLPSPVGDVALSSVA